MAVCIAQNRIHRGFGFAVILLYALYGAGIASAYILTEDKGGLRSADFFLFVVVVILLGLSNLGGLLIKRTLRIGEKSVLLVFFLYVLAKLILEDNGSRVFNLGILITEIGKHFLVGFIAFAVVRSRVPVVSRITAATGSALGVKVAAIAGTAIFISTMVYFLTLFLQTSMFSIFQLKYLANNYYQDFGDYISIAYCCLVALQISYFKQRRERAIGFTFFLLIITIQTVLVFVCSQVITSNKLVLVVSLISVFALIVCKPKRWLFKQGRITTSGLLAFPVVLSAGLLLYRYISGMDISQLRIVDYGQSSIYDNRSLGIRWQQFLDLGGDQLSNAVVFGDLSITNYIHSTLISVQTHLGSVGSLLLWSFIISGLRNVYRSAGNEDMKAIAIPILSVAVISSFFTWGPLWFLIGGMYEYAPQQSNSGSPDR